MLACKFGNVVWTTYDTYNTSKDLIDPETRGAAVRQMGQDWALAATIGKPAARGLEWIGKKGGAAWDGQLAFAPADRR